ncbi:hypothetical protein GN956_G25058 [Arapaima gigas]
MDNGYKVLTNSVVPESCRVTVADLSECFICRDGALPGQADLGHFCNCKSLVAHQSCLLTWIKKGLGSEKRPKCNVCHGESSPPLPDANLPTGPQCLGTPLHLGKTEDMDVASQKVSGFRPRLWTPRFVGKAFVIDTRYAAA